MSLPIIRRSFAQLAFVAFATVLTGCDAFEASGVTPEPVPDASLDAFEQEVNEKLDAIEKRAIPPDAGSTKND